MMLQLGVQVDSQEKVFWYVALGLGFVVILVVIALLTLLSRIVDDIDVNVDRLWTVTQRWAQNTTGMYQFAGTASVLRALREELIRHDKMLSSR
ncbi:MAG: hypothetical protein ACR2FZ_00740 [Thermoleophilaceae bacterium]